MFFRFSADDGRDSTDMIVRVVDIVKVQSVVGDCGVLIWVNNGRKKNDVYFTLESFWSISSRLLAVGKRYK